MHTTGLPPEFGLDLAGNRDHFVRSKPDTRCCPGG
jgi:hypothetical protein